jgi:signal transduction histidine kinase
MNADQATRRIASFADHVVAWSVIHAAQSKHWHRAAIAAAWWACLVVSFSLYEHFGNQWQGRWQTIGPILQRNALGWAIWIAFAPAVVVFARRWPIRHVTDWRRILPHTLYGAALALAHSLLIAAIYPLFYYRPSVAAFRDVFQDRFVSAFALDLFVYSVIVATTRAAELRAQNAEAELRLLYEQLQPHFVFNTLTSAIELTHTDAARAESVLRDLAALLRRSVECARFPLTSLSDELEFTERYIAIQCVRFPALDVAVRTDLGSLDRQVPRLLLQPLVENAIRNTVGARGTGRIVVHTAMAGSGVRIVVRDDGIGLDEGAPPSGTQGSGLGLTNVRARLAVLYRDRHNIAVTPNEEGGVTVTIDIPEEVVHA